MNKAIQDCLVSEYESLIDGFKLPDPGDRHVLQRRSRPVLRSSSPAI